jgi:hypothetical protein
MKGLFTFLLVLISVTSAMAAVQTAALGTYGPENPRTQGPPTTRAAELHDKRQEKARKAHPHKRGRLDAILFKIEDSLILERLLNPPRGIYLRLGGLGEGAGFGLGPGYRYQADRFDFRTSAAASLKGYGIGEASLLLPGSSRDGPFVEVYARRRDFPQEDFFGLGPDSLRSQRSNFALRDTLLRATGGMRARGLTTGVAVSHLSPSIGRGTDKRMPSIEQLFAPDALAGFAEQPAFAIIEPFLEYSLADPPLNPTAGGRYRVAFSRYSDRDLDRFSFNRWTLDLRQYVPFFGRTRTIALRAWMSSSDPAAGHEVPFYLQPTLGGSYSLRGFPSFRFRDRSAALLQAEYRWRINEFVSGTLFYETGAVAQRLGDIRVFERDYGFGLRAGSRNGVAFRTDLAFGSGEGTRLLVRFDNVF